MSDPKPSDQMPEEAPGQTVDDDVAGAREGGPRVRLRVDS